MIERLGKFAGSPARRPYVEKELDDLNPKDFTSKIQERIDKATNIVAILLPDDTSVPMECAFAASRSKPILIIYSEGTLPRLLLSLPRTKIEKWGPSTKTVVSDFLKAFN